MEYQWYYSRAGAAYGPFSMAEIRKHAAEGKLSESDLVWQKGTDPKNALPAQAALDFAKLAPARRAAPDWLDDVAKAERKGPLPGPVGSAHPDWLDDLRLWYGLGVLSTAISSLSSGGQAISTQGISALIERWSEPASRVNQKTELIPPTKTRTVVDTQTPCPALSAVEETIAERAVEETGFDLKTGQILDPAKFQKWQVAQRGASGASTNPSLVEAFRRARTAISNWLDDDSRVPLILANDRNALMNDAALATILKQYDDYGTSMRQRLLCHLEFLIENRRKFYAAQSRV